MAGKRSANAPSVVLADDHQAVAEAVRQVISPGFNVIKTVGDGVALLEAVAELHPDLILVDVQMPRLTGIEAAQKILAKDPDAAIVLLSSYGDLELVEKAFALGVKAYVLKSRARSDLAPALRSALKGKAFVGEGIPREMITPSRAALEREGQKSR